MIGNYFFSSSGAAAYEIEQSLRFDGGRPSRLTYDNSSGTNNSSSAWTLSFWMKRGSDVVTSQYGNDLHLMMWTPSGSCANTEYFLIADPQHGTTSIQNSMSFNGGGYSGNIANKLRDCSAWYHFVWRGNTGSSSNIIYINGEPVTAYNQGPSSMTSQYVNGQSRWSIGNSYTGCSSNPWDGYLAEVHFVDGQTLAHTDFGEFDDNGVWRPIQYTGTYGTNGYYLKFDPSATNGVGHDHSGNGHHWTASNINTSGSNTDVFSDTPTNNFMVWNRNNKYHNDQHETQEANLRFETVSSGDSSEIRGTFATNTGKWYCEFTLNSANGTSVGLVQSRYRNYSSWIGNGVDPTKDAYSWAFRTDNGSTFHNQVTTSSYGSSLGNGDILMMAWDVDAGKIWWGKNGTWFSSGNPASGTNPAYTDSDISSGEYLDVACGHPGTNASITMNAGQRAFGYTPPTGFEPLSTAELPNVDITNPSEHFQTVLTDDPPEYAEPATRGASYGGGFYAGRIKDGDKVYNIIVAPASSGNLYGEYPGTTRWARYTSAKPLAYSQTYGGDATFNYGDGGNNNFVFDWAAYTSTGPNAGTVDETNATGTGIGGYNDWYVPAYKELELIYRTFKPTTTSNNTGAGTANDAAVPPTGVYTSSDPSQTSVSSFQSGGSNALSSSHWYWSASQSSSNGAVGFVRHMNNGATDGQNVQTSTNNKIRAIRREFAYDATILDYAQDTFSNGLWWIKDRANSNQHQLVDSVNGTTKVATSPNGNPNGSYANPSGSSVAWCWNAPNSFSSTAGTISTSGYRNVDSGFSIFSYTSNGTAGATIGHGLNEAPEFWFVKARDGSANFVVAHPAIPKNQWMAINASFGPQTDNVWNNTNASNTVITLGNYGDTNSSSSQVYTCYAWHSIPGFSAFGSYVGNGNTDGPFAFTGHRPGWIMIKEMGSASWAIYDPKRSPYNPTIASLRSNEVTQEQQLSSVSWDILSNGFKVRNNNADYNTSGTTYIWASFAEHPFGGGNVSPSPAR